MRRNVVYLCLSAVFLFMLSLSAFAENTDGPWDRFNIKLGGFVTSLSSNVRIGSPTSVGVDIDLEDTLGLESSQSVFRVDALYRFGQSSRHVVDFSYLDLRRDATKIFGIPAEQVTPALRRIAKSSFVFPQFYGSWYRQCAENIWELLRDTDNQSPGG